MGFTFSYVCPNEDCEEYIEASGHAGYCATYNDPGDPGEIDIPECCPKCGTAIDADKAFDEMLREMDRRYDDDHRRY